MLNVLDIFSGIGGFSIGLEAAGLQTVAFCEINPFCRKILKRHWPSVPIFSDITTINKEDLKALPRIDVIAGGFPCQDISVAGKRKGITAKRSGLWKEFVRLINEIRPKYAIIENVANLRSTGLISVLQDLWTIGYDAEWHCIPASAFGAPHRRDRIWIIAYPSCIGKVGFSFAKKETQSTTGDSSKNVFGYKIVSLDRHYRF
jgi:DNA (cytosine-5)-methyltransferase 1